MYKTGRLDGPLCLFFFYRHFFYVSTCIVSISDGMGCISAYGMSSLHIWKCTINAEKYIQVLEQHMVLSR